jgi:hypothetical protein
MQRERRFKIRPIPREMDPADFAPPTVPAQINRSHGTPRDRLAPD